jgi:RNA 2',3'-cyclic 3'-phosphodiesterase
VPLNNIHLTLHFFGDTEEKLIPAISGQLAEAVCNISAFDIKISDFGIFGSSYKPRVIWMGIHPNENINLLSQNIATNLSKIGYTPDRQNFVPHITIGRIRFINNKQLFQKQLDEVKNKFIQQSMAKQLYLFESILSSKGPTYHIIETFYFKV